VRSGVVAVGCSGMPLSVGSRAMCIAVYLGALEPLPLVPWDERHRGFHVDAIDETQEQDRVVRERLGTPYVYYAGSSDGCGCGFQFQQDPEWAKERGEYELELATLRAFRDYLDSALQQLHEVRFFAFWEGESWKEPMEHRRLVPDDLTREDFLFVEGEVSEFVRSNPGA
jgi:hypothetical protein